MGGGGRNGVGEVGRGGGMEWRVGVIYIHLRKKKKEKKKKKKEEDKHHIRGLTYCVMFLVGS